MHEDRRLTVKVSAYTLTAIAVEAGYTITTQQILHEDRRTAIT